jgi:hypothetical protein
MMEPVVVDATHRDSDDERDVFMSKYGIAIARRVRWFQLVAAALLWFSFYLTFVVYAGQVLMHENKALQADQVSHARRVKEAAAQDERKIQEMWTTAAARGPQYLLAGYCDLSVPPSSDHPLEIVRLNIPMGASVVASSGENLVGMAQHHAVVHVSERHRELCQEGKRLASREQDLVASHKSWRTVAAPVMYATAPWFIVASPPGSKVRDRQLESHYYFMQQIVYGLLTGIMPAMYAALGALASLFRRLSEKAERERLAPVDYGGMISSVVLGGLTGAVIGLFANVIPQGGQGPGLPLTTTALALLAGYAVDRAFTMFDNLANRVFLAPDPSGTAKS